MADDIISGSGHFLVNVHSKSTADGIEVFEDVRSWKVAFDGTLVIRTVDQIVVFDEDGWLIIRALRVP